MRATLHAIAVGFASLGVLGSAWGQELTKETCITANETGQDLRRDGKLVEAREGFELCAVPACPAILREDCAMRLAGLGRAQPTVTFVAKDANDAPIAGLRVRIDGAPAVSGDGAPIPVDPGEHRFELEAKGYAPIGKTLSFTEGLRTREEIILTSKALMKVEERTDADTGSPRRTIGYVLGAAGVGALAAGAVFGVLAGNTHDDARGICGGGLASCSPGTGSDAQARMDVAGTQADVSTIAFVAGAALVAGGLYLLFASPSKRRSNGAAFGTVAIGR
jgi:hypothetical protein